MVINSGLQLPSLSDGEPHSSELPNSEHSSPYNPPNNKHSCGKAEAFAKSNKDTDPG